MSYNTDSRLGRTVPEFVRKEDAPGVRFDAGPYLGIVKENRDPTRSGRLQVWIPDLGGDPSLPNNWRTVWYASPFLGSTVQDPPDGKSKSGSKENKFSKVRHTYGMWYNVPDLENFVICTFLAGDPERGFWFACVPNQLGHHMVPAIGASKDIEGIDKIEDEQLKKVVKQGLPYPVAEFNEYRDEVKFDQFTKEKKPIHEPQVKILVEQGTDRENLTKTRGIIQSSSQRETPAGVFGISTPGRTKGKPPAANAKTAERKISTRLGGHSFVLDDGDESGNNNLTRWRSAGGHQILMDDKEKILYIANSNGSVWIEMTNAGHLNIYSANNLNIRTQADLNWHVDKDFNLHVEGDIRVKAKKSINFESESLTSRTDKDTTIFGGSVKIGSEGAIDIMTTAGGSITTGKVLTVSGEKILLNSGKGPNVNKPRDLPLKSSADTKKDGNGQWQVEENKIKSVSKIVPTHEPWPRKAGTSSSSSNSNEGGEGDNQDVTEGSPPYKEGSSAPSNSRTTSRGTPVVSGTGGAVTDSQGNPILSESPDAEGSPGIEQAQRSKLSRAAPEHLLKAANAPNPSDGIGDLSQQEYRGLLTQIGYSESGLDYGVVEKTNGNYLGRYQMGAAALVDTGHIHPSAYKQYGTKAVQYPSSWTGKDGIGSKEDFLASGGVQEKAIQSYHSKLYASMERNGAIRPDDDAATKGGMVAVAQLLGAKGAKDWRDTGVGQDANKTTGATYFNRGRYAVEYLGGKA